MIVKSASGNLNSSETTTIEAGGEYGGGFSGCVFISGLSTYTRRDETDGSNFENVEDSEGSKPSSDVVIQMC